MTDHAKTIVDLSSITVVLATLVEWLPCGGSFGSQSSGVGHSDLRNQNCAEGGSRNVASNSNVVWRSDPARRRRRRAAVRRFPKIKWKSTVG